MSRAALAAATLLLASIVVASPREAAACTCRAGTPAAYLAAADVAFAGRVRAVRSSSAEFVVDAVFKGAAARTTTVAPRQEGSCAVAFAESGRYTVFAHRQADVLVTSLCDGTTDDHGLLQRAGIRAIAMPHDAPAPRTAATKPAATTAPSSRAIPIALALSLALLAAGMVRRGRAARGGD